MLNIRRRLLTPKMTRKVPSQWGRKKERKKKKNQKRNQQPWGEAEGKERFLQSEYSLMWGNQRGQKGAYRGSKENMVDHLRKAGQSKNCAHGLYCSLAQPESCVSCREEAGCWKVGFGAWTQEGDSCWL